MAKSLIPALLIILTICTGCDAFRILAGRPTSRDIEDKKAEIAWAKYVEKQRAADSLALEETVRIDTLAVEEQPAAENVDMSKVRRSSSLGGLSTTALSCRYYVIVGAFKEMANAEKMTADVAQAGYPGTIISFRNGLNAVGLCQTNDRNAAFDSLDKLKKESFCPADAWILANDQL